MTRRCGNIDVALTDLQDLPDGFDCLGWPGPIPEWQATTSRTMRLFRDGGLIGSTHSSAQPGQPRDRRGETVWLRGWNGSGKTTLLRLIATAISPTFGGGSVLGFDLRTERSAIRARSDLLSHETRLYGDLTAAENLGFACSRSDLDDSHRALERQVLAAGTKPDTRAARS
jgi:hypothetical protein